MKRIAALLCFVIGCRSVPITPGGATGSSSAGAGAATPRAAVEQLLAAAKVQDLQAISAIWGAENGLARDHMDRAQLETREFDIACVLRSDTQKVGDASPGENGRMFVVADLTQGKNAGSIRFDVAQTRDRRWLVANFDITVLQNKGFCSRPGGG